MKNKVLGILGGLSVFALIFAIGLSTVNSLKVASPEISIHSLSPLGRGFGKAVAASCGYSNEGHDGTDTVPCRATYSCPGGGTADGPGAIVCGGACQPVAATNPTSPIGYGCRIVCGSRSDHGSDCNNPRTECTRYTCPDEFVGDPTAVNNGTPNSCFLAACSNLCTAGITPSVSYTGTGFRFLNNRVYYFTNVVGRPTPQYTLGTCPQSLPANTIRVVDIHRYSNDGTVAGSWSENYDTNKTTWTPEPPRTYPYTEYIRIRASYVNTITGASTTQGYVRADAVILHPNYGLPCSKTDQCSVVTNGTYDESGVCNAVEPSYSSCNRTNVCGKDFAGVQCPSGCQAPGYGNDTCITSLNVAPQNVNPNGSVTFNWSVDNTTARASCGFVDLTTSTPRPIPGLQNLDTTVDRATINNIQASTRFCLVCKFYSLTTNAYLGEAVKHQWVRVQRIGEN